MVRDLVMALVGGGLGGASMNRLISWEERRRRRNTVNEIDEMWLAIWRVMNTPNVTDEEIVLAIRGVIQMPGIERGMPSKGR